MAAPSTWRCSWQQKKSSNSSSFTIFSLTKKTQITQSSFNPNPNPKGKIILKSIRGRPIEVATSLILRDQKNLISEIKIEEIREKEIGLEKKSGGGGRRPLWRRILFASKKVRSILLLNVITVIYASNIPVIKEVEAIMDPAVFTVIRFTVSAIPFIPFVLRTRGNVQIRDAGLELGIWVSLGYLMQALGLLTSDAGRASFISLFTVIIVPLIDGMLGATVPVYTWFGALMSLIGVGMLETSGSPPCIGDLWNFLGAVFFGIHMLRTEHISRNTKRENFLALLGYEICVVAVFSIVWYMISGGFSSVSELDPGSWTWALTLDWIVQFPWIPALYTGIFSTGVCLWVEMAAMRDVSATETAIIYGLEPLWGAGFAWFLLGERWGVIGWIGAALVLGGSLTVQIFGSLPPSKSAEEERSGKGDSFLVPDNRNLLSPARVVASSGKEVQDRLKNK
ncbi:hypothetical protein ACHQM5_030729 [Ranunculus cassubicifolius]